VEIRVLGPLEVVGDDGQVMDVGGPRPRALLIALALAGGHPVPADQLLDQVWQGEQAMDRNRLQVHISRLRRTLGGDCITTRGGGYALAAQAGALDADQFERLAAQARAALQREDAATAAGLLRRALGLWRGAPLAEFADTGFAPPVITRLEEARLAAIEDRIEADLMLGGHGELTGELEALVRAHPLRERLWGQLIVALYRSGRQGDALGAYQRARTVLADELGVDPGPELRRLESAVLSQDPTLGVPGAGRGRADRPRSGNLPAARNALIGRRAELGHVASLLRDSRLVSVVGVGGAGKTRLAIEVARSLTGEYRDGAWLVELASVASAASAAAVASAAAAALGVAPDTGSGVSRGMLDRLTEFLSGRQLLLVLDNCEHVVAGAAEVADYLLARCPVLRILATSRESLAVDGESLWPLPPLAAAEASDLFVVRARAIAPGFQPDEPTMKTVAGICTRLDGLPLAIELAAARMRAFAADDVLARLGDRFRLLTSGTRTALPRHATLRAVVDWSYDLLFDEERRVFERMSVFAGSCPLEAAEQVCAGDPVAAEDVADLLARLVDKSLVTATPTGRGIRFGVLQTLAQYGQERLATRGDVADVRARHARWVASVADVPDGAHTAAWFATIGEYLDDVRRGVESALALADADTSLDIACGLGWFWGMGGVVDDCWRWLTAGLALGPAGTARRVRALAIAEQLALAEGRDRALEYGEEAVGLGRGAGGRPALAFAALLHGPSLTGLFDQRERGIQLLDEAGVLLEAEEDDWSLGTGALARGAAALGRGDLDQAQDLLRRAADRFADADDAQGAAAALHNLADLAIARGRYDEAITALREALTGLDAGAAAGITSMALLGCLCGIQGRSGEADQWHAGALAAAQNQQHLGLIAFACNARGLTLRRRGHLAEAEQCHQRALDICRERGLPAGLAMAHASLGYIAELRNDVAAAERHHRISLDAACEAPDRQAQALALEGLASTASLRDDPRTAGRLLGAATALRKGKMVAAAGAHLAHRGSALGHLDRIDIDRTIARMGSSSAYHSAYADGLHDPQAVLDTVRA
jgi:predicted ATPase/DNA-binding SARP family transcriptional activator/tetratricopeptide (TPR) repeat protein